MRRKVPRTSQASIHQSAFVIEGVSFFQKKQAAAATTAEPLDESAPLPPHSTIPIPIHSPRGLAEDPSTKPGAGDSRRGEQRGRRGSARSNNSRRRNRRNRRRRKRCCCGPPRRAAPRRRRRHRRNGSHHGRGETHPRRRDEKEAGESRKAKEERERQGEREREKT
jgi:hypothetical protein